MQKQSLKLTVKTLGLLFIPAVFLFFVVNNTEAAVGLSVGSSGLNLGQTENLFYGNTGASSNASSSFLLFQKNNIDKFKVDINGNLTTSGAISAGSIQQSEISTYSGSVTTVSGLDYKDISWKEGVSILDRAYQYKLQVYIGLDTSSPSGATYLIRDTADYVSSAATWEIRLVNQSEEAGAHVFARIDPVNLDRIQVWHAGSAAYVLRYRVEAIHSYNNNSGFSIFGADYMWQRSINKLFYTEGNVGIGTTAPANKLEVKGGDIKIDGTGIAGGRALVIQRDGATNPWKLIQGHNSTNALEILEGSNTRLMILSGGNVGIGTTAPDEPLSVYYSDTNYGMPMILNNTATTGNVYNGIRFKQGTTESFNLLTTNTATNLRGYGAIPMHFYTDNVIRATISATGNVGIGTTSFGTSKLNVNGNIGMAGTSGTSYLYFPDTGSHTGNMQLQAGFGSAAAGGGLTLYGASHTTKPGWVTADISQSAGSGATEGRFTVNNSGTGGGTDVFTVLRTGNVGIGTTAPRGNLDITGTDAVATTTATANGNLIVGATGTGVINSMGVSSAGTPNAWIQPRYATSATYYNLVLNPNGGNVGVATTNPGYKLDVSGNLRVDAGASLAGYFQSTADVQISLNSTDTWTGITFNDSGAVNDQLYFHGTYGTFSIGGGGSNVSGKKLHIEGGTSIGTGYRSLAVPANGLAVEGSVGVGTTTPASKLSVSGGNIFINDAAITSGTPKAAITKEYLDSALGVAQTAFWNLSGSNLYASSTSWNIGIGTTTPANKLEVVGTVSATGVSATYYILNGENFLQRVNPPGDLTLRLGDFNDGGWGMQFWSGNNQTMTLDTAGNVGIGAIDPGAYKLNVAGSIYATGLTLGGDANLGGNNITGVNKLTVSTIDPLYSIQGINYSTFASAIVGGVKEEYVGRISIDKKLSNNEYEKIIDFDKIEPGSDLWVWRQVIDFSPENVQVLITPYGNFADTYYSVEGNRLIFRANRTAEISYRLVAKRFDWREWPTKALDQTEKAGLIIH